MSENNQVIKLETPNDLKVFLYKNYMNQIKNFFSDEKQAMKFLSSVIADVQKAPKLMECDGNTLITSYITMAQLGFMPSDVSGEAYVLPYKDKNRGMIAQFQLGYKGIVTLLYKAGVSSIFSDIVREEDVIEIVRGKIKHIIDPRKSIKQRGSAIGAYVIFSLNGEEIGKYMHKDDILEIGKRFSKSWDTNFTPWKENNDPQLWQWKKTVLKQGAKLLPKNETINKAIAIDNEESDVHNNGGIVESSGLQMGNFLKEPEKKENATSKKPPKKAEKEQAEDKQETNSEATQEGE